MSNSPSPSEVEGNINLSRKDEMVFHDLIHSHGVESFCESDCIVDYCNHGLHPVDSEKFNNLPTRCARIFDCYIQYNKQSDAERLLKRILDVSRSCDKNSWRFGMLMLASLEPNSLIKLDNICRGILNEVSAQLCYLIELSRPCHCDALSWFWLEKTNSSSEFDTLWITEFLRKISHGEGPKRDVDELTLRLMREMIEAAKKCHSDNAFEWCQRAAEFARFRLGDHTRESQFLSIQKEILAHRQPNPNPIIEDLQKIIKSSAEKFMQNRFIPSYDQFKAEYANLDSKNYLHHLIIDERLVPEENKIKLRQQNEKGLLSQLPMAEIDRNLNQRAIHSSDSSEVFWKQNIQEITDTVHMLLQDFVSQKSVTVRDFEYWLPIDSYVNKVDYDVIRSGVDAFIRGEHIASAHILVPCFESLLLVWLEAKGVHVNATQGQGVNGRVLAHRFFKKENNKQVKQLLGNRLYQLISRYFFGPVGFRHFIAHGWITAKECSPVAAMSIALTLRSHNVLFRESDRAL